jgi:hypothetical protein
MTGNINGAEKGTSIEIHDFEAQSSPISTAPGVDRSRNKNLIAALKNVQLVKEVHNCWPSSNFSFLLVKANHDGNFFIDIFNEERFMRNFYK